MNTNDFITDFKTMQDIKEMIKYGQHKVKGTWVNMHLNVNEIASLKPMKDGTNHCLCKVGDEHGSIQMHVLGEKHLKIV